MTRLKTQSNRLHIMAKAAMATVGASLLTSPVFADVKLGIPDSVTERFSITDLSSFIGAILQLLFIIAGILVFVYLVWGGLQWLTSGGDSSKTQAARDRITSALVGLAIIALAYALTIVIQYFFGLDVIGPVKIPTPYEV